MAELNIRYGKQASLNTLTQKNPGTIYITNDTHQMYVDLPDASNENKRIHISGLIRCETVAELQALTPYNDYSLYYVAEKGALLMYTGNSNDKADDSGINNGVTQSGGSWKQLNKQVVTAEQFASIEADIEELQALFDRVNTVEGKVSTLEGKMSTAESDIVALKLDIEGITGGEGSSSLGALNTKVEELNTEVDTLSSTVSELSTAFDTQGGKIDTLEGKVSNLETLSGTVSSQGQDIEAIKGVNSTQDSDISNLKTSVQTINTTIEEIEAVVADIPGIKEKDAAQDEKLATAEQNISDLQTTSGQQAEQILALQNKDSALESTVQGHTSTINEHAEAINSLNGKVTAAESNISDLQSRMGTAESDIDGLTEDLAAVDEKADQNANNISGLQTRMGTAESTLTEHESAIDGINENIDSIEEDIANKYDDILARMDAVNSMAFKGAVGSDGKTLPADAENANREDNLINAGDTYLVNVPNGNVYRYKVGNDASPVSAYAGDLIVALSDQSEPGYYNDWQLISSGYVRDFNPELSANDSSITLTSIIASADQDLGDLGKITFETPSETTGGVKVNFTKATNADEVTGKISIVWGTF